MVGSVQSVIWVQALFIITECLLSKEVILRLRKPRVAESFTSLSCVLIDGVVFFFLIRQFCLYVFPLPSADHGPMCLLFSKAPHFCAITLNSNCKPPSPPSAWMPSTQSLPCSWSSHDNDLLALLLQFTYHSIPMAGIPMRPSLLF